jgi:hypothetical protein
MNLSFNSYKQNKKHDMQQYLRKKLVPHDNISKIPRFINQMCRDGHITSLLVVICPHISSDDYPGLNSSHIFNGFFLLQLILCHSIRSEIKQKILKN